MGSVNDESNDEWCVRTFNLIDEDTGPVVRWVVEGRDSTLEKWRVVAQIRRPKDVEELVELIDREIKSCDKKHVRVLAWQFGTKNQASTKKWLERCDDEIDDDDDFDGSARSMLALSMKQIQFLFRQNTATQAATMRYMGESVDKLRRENDDLRDEKYKFFELMQDLLDRRADREAKARNGATFAKAVDAGIGILQWKMTGGRAQGQPDLAEAITNLSDSFSTEQLERLHSSGILRPEQEIALLQLLSDPRSPKEAVADEHGDQGRDVADSQMRQLAVPTISKDVLLSLRERLPPERYAEAVERLRESQRLLGDPLTAFVSGDGDSTDA